MPEQVRFDSSLEVLANTSRREGLLALREHNPQADDEPDPLDIHASDTDETPEFDIHMNHLPMFNELGIIEWDRKADEISQGPDWDEFAPLLKLIDDHRDELPEGYFE
jgi:hypothetical protein